MSFRDLAEHTDRWGYNWSSSPELGFAADEFEAATHDLVDDPSIAGVVALASWWPQGTEADGFDEKRTLLVVHGTADRWTDPRTSRRATERAMANGADAEYLSVPGGHFMLRDPRVWSRVTRDFVLRIADESRVRTDSSESGASTGCRGESS